MTSKGLISIVVPAYNEQDVLRVFHERLSVVLTKLAEPVEVIYVNDGSSDDTLEVLLSLKENDARVAIIDLSRNFGKEIALTAGLDHASGDAVIVIDADLQDPPELIPEFLQQWREGYDVVYAQRTEREGESALKKATAYVFYRLIQRASHVNIPEDAGDFRLLSRRAVDSLKQLREQHRFMKGLFAWIGYPQKAVSFQRDARAAGQTKWNYWRLWNFALEGITSFTTAPLKFATYIGLITAIAAFTYGVWIIYKTLAFGDPVHGYPSLMVVILFLGGVQLFTIGIIGEYLGRMFNETKRRPLYIVKDYLPAGAPPKNPSRP
jgi:glycosyltransferase involved in cell wall biosynthesis